MSEPTSTTQQLYETASEGVRITFGAKKDEALAYYGELIRFVGGVLPAAGSPRLLDVGCGCGWSTFAFARQGYLATGLDLNDNAFEPPATERLTFRRGSAMDIPFPEDSFDVVVTYQCLEHVPDPERALTETGRVCKPSGVVCVVGPNLVSPTVPLVYLCKPRSWREMRFIRRPDTTRHPYGNTVWEILGSSVLRFGQLSDKLLRRRPRFTMRQPDPRPPFHADNDACYLCNPVDLITFFRSHGYRVERRGKPGRPPLSYLFAGGTWVAARKPTARAAV